MNSKYYFIILIAGRRKKTNFKPDRIENTANMTEQTIVYFLP